MAEDQAPQPRQRVTLDLDVGASRNRTRSMARRTEHSAVGPNGDAINAWSCPAGVSPTDDRDQAYVIDLCDEILGEVGHRETRFDWLRGDARLTRAGAMLPVDAYYPNARLVIEYWERQHFEPIAHFDKPDRMTVSGVHRGEQRKRYDALREREIPANGLSLIIVKYSDLDVGRQGRLRRSVSQDRIVLQRILDSR